ncbi:hypothetical protein JOD31_001485 [Methylopila capsulata]|uniref:Mannosyltransferase n=1 Tax=Methylopila capsulata TaxID=61654 RepID=A0A9W6IPV3_9HYPH|nr:glycosyltransferase [Methylopila capsulata]MBM7851260.1 hypothetical protein [Methylopila capsulata]GLK54318.1 hypothetical protein GCM10008170_03370 [Methylopila capsulata]
MAMAENLDSESGSASTHVMPFEIRRLASRLNPATNAEDVVAATIAEILALDLTDYEEVVYLASAAMKNEHHDATAHLLENAVRVRPEKSILSRAGYTAREHALRFRLAQKSSDSVVEAGLTTLRSPEPRNFTHLPHVGFDFMREACDHGGREIPRTIHQIWIGGRAAPQQPQDEWGEWCEKYGYTYRLWDEDACKTLSCYAGAPFQSFYGQKRYAGAADILRAEILALHGGLYVDMDMFPVDTGYPLHEVLPMRGMLCLAAKSYRKMTAGGLYVTNSVLGSTAGHPVMKRYFDAMGPSWQRMPQESAWWSVGACLLTASLVGGCNTISPDHVGTLGKADFDDRHEALRAINKKRAMLFFSAKPWR